LNSFATDTSASTQAERLEELSQNSMAGRARIVRSSDARPKDKTTPAPSYGSLEIFFDAYDVDAREKFLTWRERNWRGYVIRCRSPGDGMLHRAGCGHFEHGDKAASLTHTMKVCSQNKTELEDWARENMSRGLKRCRSCM
jgi:hypothetical protein